MCPADVCPSSACPASVCPADACPSLGAVSLLGESTRSPGVGPSPGTVAPPDDCAWPPVAGSWARAASPPDGSGRSRSPRSWAAVRSTVNRTAGSSSRASRRSSSSRRRGWEDGVPWPPSTPARAVRTWVAASPRRPETRGSRTERAVGPRSSHRPTYAATCSAVSGRRAAVSRTRTATRRASAEEVTPASAWNVSPVSGAPRRRVRKASRTGPGWVARAGTSAAAGTRGSPSAQWRRARGRYRSRVSGSSTRITRAPPYGAPPWPAPARETPSCGTPPRPAPSPGTPPYRAPPRPSPVSGTPSYAAPLRPPPCRGTPP
ncbi:hypothetical protein ACIPRD_00160 [Streptomyces sp. NPDC090108]|uniref:hypothetical protein n=1 Tax=Streptomyces sp. NPDC090108 TaxID=3365947 RepID=UPI0038273CE2